MLYILNMLKVVFRIFSTVELCCDIFRKADGQMIVVWSVRISQTGYLIHVQCISFFFVALILCISDTLHAFT